MLELLRQPWPWYVSGTAIAAVMVMLLFFGKSFGVSANLRTMCAIAGAGRKTAFFNFDWRTQRWNLLFLFGSVLGGFIAATFLNSGQALTLSAATITDLNSMGIQFDGQLNPGQIFGEQIFSSLKGMFILLFGGMLVGFGARYAGGCTSGHAISGLSNLQFPSLIAVAGFFAGGLIMSHIFLPLIF
ncbi:YeeE/YedE thiosulfate transporter family protein [Pedobacter panaciterrae]|uniref:YeeE/YedE thiosulfate transporter family protein n=1 Tax=Pedobacter panaciterrae TaxID=363849 RepID=A0ABU8NIM7_9SPHI